ncbi:MAG: hypothetical protein EOO71_36385 [Myxococcaceae bacterium]|nr:MAG: hypothetical protein EOO71_36385 [Myxococcaceae bacterium]
MSRLFLLGCVVLLSACRMKEPEEGLLRVIVRFSTYQPQCVRVEVSGKLEPHRAATDIPASQFTEPDAKETRIAMVRRPEWGRSLRLTVSSFDAATGEHCTGALVETYDAPPLNVQEGSSARWTVRLKATDADGDGYFVDAPGSSKLDCNDANPSIHPGATEQCDATVDVNCNTLIGCQETACQGLACDDGNACTQGDHCEGNGSAGRCMPATTIQCTQPSNPCDAPVTCEPSTGLCKVGTRPTGTACNDENPCTINDQCIGGLCAGSQRQCPTDSNTCRESTGACNQNTGLCEYAPRPNATACDDALTCTTTDHCDGNGACVGTPTACAAPAQCLRLAQVCTTAADCRYDADPVKLNTPCATPTGVPGVCMPTGACSPFPYPTSNFDPGAITASDIQGLTTTGNVTFNSDTLMWNPVNAVQNPAQLKFLTLPQGTGAPDAVLLPVSTLDLGGTLTLVGSRPLILAVFGDANVDQHIFVNGSTTVAGAGANQQCGSATGAAGQFANRKGGGGGGGGNGTAGKEGGRGYNGGNPGSAGSARAAALVPLIGGCAGGDGGELGPALGGKGGAGGGAFQLSVARTLTVSKRITASGRGGGGGIGNSSAGAAGGGGGGSGGRVVLEAFQVTLAAEARLTANGGGGGEGSTAKSNNSDNGSAGANGSDDQSTPALGGQSASTSAGDGGAGGAGTTAPQVGGNGETFNGYEGGGGGGGGAVGYIHLRSVQTCSTAGGAVISPPATGGCPAP